MNTPGTNLGYANGFIIGAPFYIVFMYTGCDWEENVLAESFIDMLSFKFPRFTKPLPIDHASFFSSYIGLIYSGKAVLLGGFMFMLENSDVNYYSGWANKFFCLSSALAY